MRTGVRPFVRVAAIRAAVQRFSFTLLLTGAVGLLMMGKFDAVLIDSVRTRISDAVGPLLDALSRPAAGLAGVLEQVQEMIDLRARNAALEAENAALRQFQQAAFRLESENLSLRKLLNYQPEAAHAFVTARVVADNSGAFVRSLGINLGAQNGIADGQAVVSGSGLVGRIVQTGTRSARVLLITDLNARIPVMLEQSRHRAILAGDNSGLPELLYLPGDAHIRPGDRIVTSGHGGMFPAGLPIGTVEEISDGRIRVEPMEDLSRLEYVRILEFPVRAATAGLEPAPGYQP